VISLRNRAGARSPLVAILGHQKAAKGVDRLPAIVEQLLRERADIRLLLQVAGVDGSEETLQALRAIASRTDRLQLIEEPAGRSRWPQLLEMADLILCPHRPEFYFGNFSSIAAEALANGIPLVVPAGTSLETLLMECGAAGTTFERFEVTSIVAATAQALDRFDQFATRAYEAAVAWPRSRGPARMVDGLMRMITAA
jgi:glycosyltransferase involved in cell wall biosynthesis